GRFPALWLVARPDLRRSRPVRHGGRLVEGVDGARLYVEEEGAGPTVLLTHGWGLDRTIWRSTRADLRGRFRLVAWDLPGLGLSRPGPQAPPSLSRFAEDLRALVLARGEPVGLVGDSIGGMIIQTLARDHPKLFGREVAGIVLLNTTYTDPPRTMVGGWLARRLR